MSLFDRFKKKTTEANDVDHLLLNKLKQQLTQMGYQVALIEHGVVIESHLTIHLHIIKDPDLHPSMMAVAVKIENEYLPEGIEENLTGVGETAEVQIDSALKNFLSISFPPVLDVFSESHKSDLDFMTEIVGRRILFHPKVGSLGLQGEWTVAPKQDVFFELLKNQLSTQLLDRKFNWLKIYASKLNNGSTHIQCSMNNQDWKEGEQIIQNYVDTWNTPISFLGLKQTIMFRLCDAY